MSINIRHFHTHLLYVLCAFSDYLVTSPDTTAAVTNTIRTTITHCRHISRSTPVMEPGLRFTRHRWIFDPVSIAANLWHKAVSSTCTFPRHYHHVIAYQYRIDMVWNTRRPVQDAHSCSDSDHGDWWQIKWSNCSCCEFRARGFVWHLQLWVFA